MSTLNLTIAGKTAMLATPGLLARLDMGGAASIDLYDTTIPADAEDAAAVVDVPLVTIILAVPGGNTVDGVLTLVQDDTDGDMIAVTGAATWGLLRAGDGEPMGIGAATGALGAGPFKVVGSTGTDLFAGARAKLGAVAIG